jgi:hypothetical protein
VDAFREATERCLALADRVEAEPGPDLVVDRLREPGKSDDVAEGVLVS